MTKIEASGSGSIGKRHESADPNPYQNVIDPQYWWEQYRKNDSHLLQFLLMKTLDPEMDPNPDPVRPNMLDPDPH